MKRVIFEHPEVLIHVDTAEALSGVTHLLVSAGGESREFPVPTQKLLAFGANLLQTYTGLFYETSDEKDTAIIALTDLVGLLVKQSHDNHMASQLFREQEKNKELTKRIVELRGQLNQYRHELNARLQAEHDAEQTKGDPSDAF